MIVFPLKLFQNGIDQWKIFCGKGFGRFLTSIYWQIYFKLIHQYYPAKTFIAIKFNLSIDVNCTFCDTQPETVLHMF